MGGEEVLVEYDIRPVTVPERLGTPEAVDFEASAAVGTQLERANWGHEDFADTAAHMLARRQNDTHRDYVLFGAWDGETMIGRASVGWEREPDASTVELTLGVLPAHRRRGVGSRLLAAAEQAARDHGKSTSVAYSDHPDAGTRSDEGPVLHAPDGDAELPASVPAARFAEAHGYVLAQLERVSSLRLDGRIEKLRRELEARTARATAAGYRLALWTAHAPADLVDAYAAAKERMAIDVPAGGVTIDEERWDAARVREYESASLDGGMNLLVAAAVTTSGAVAGYTELQLPSGREFAYQYDTLVVGAHRGHGLGMLVKLANLVELAAVAPERAVVYTWNADENDHMLAINIALGFRRCGLEAAWQRDLTATTDAHG